MQEAELDKNHSPSDHKEKEVIQEGEKGDELPSYYSRVR